MNGADPTEKGEHRLFKKTMDHEYIYTQRIIHIHTYKLMSIQTTIHTIWGEGDKSPKYRYAMMSGNINIVNTKETGLLHSHTLRNQYQIVSFLCLCDDKYL